MFSRLHGQVAGPGFMAHTWQTQLWSLDTLFSAFKLWCPEKGGEGSLFCHQRTLDGSLGALGATIILAASDSPHLHRSARSSAMRSSLPSESPWGSGEP